MTNPGRQTARVFVVMVFVPAAASAVMLSLGWRMTDIWGGRTAIEAMLLAQILLLAVVYASILPIVRKLASADGLGRLKLAMRAGGVRFLLTVSAVAAVLFGGWVEKRPFLIWIGVGYVVMTLAETMALARWLNKTGNSA